MKKIFTMAACALVCCTAATAQYVGIGTSSPAYKLHVIGSTYSTGDTYVGGYLGIGTTTPAYKLQVNDGSIAVFNSTDLKTWYMNYQSGGNYFQVSEGGVSRMTFANGGNIGIGTNTPGARLDVNGSANVETNLTVGGTASVTGNITMNGKGMLYNAAGSGKLRYYTRTAAFTVVNLAPHGISPEGAIGFSGFTSAPEVFVGDITTTGGTTGQLWKLQLIIYDVTASGCKCRISNTSNTTCNQDITWNISCIGVGN